MTSPAFLTALQAQLRTRFAAIPDLAGVPVELYRGGTVSTPVVVLIRGRVEHGLTPNAMARVRREEVRVPALVGTHGDLDAAVALAGRIIGEIELELRDNCPQVGNTALAATSGAVERIAWAPLVNDKGGVVVDNEFDITYQAAT